MWAEGRAETNDGSFLTGCKEYYHKYMKPGGRIMFWGQNKDNVYIVGHRGVKALYPENTMLSFEKALEYGVDGIETDIHMTTDGQLVLHHDDLLERTTTGTGLIESYSYQELRALDAGVKFSPEFSGQYIPRFEELLELVKDTDIVLNVEMKDYRPEALDKTIKTLERYGFGERYVIACFNGEVTTLAHEKYGVKTQGFPLYLVKNADEKTESHYYSVGIPMKDLTSELCESYVAKGIDPWCWCQDTEEQVREALACGATLMTVNDPRPALKILRGKC